MSPQNDRERDALADALALVDATHRRDDLAAGVLLAHGDPRRIAGYLAQIAADLLEDLSEWIGADMDSMLVRQREGWLMPGWGGDGDD
jgi:hypothetical protein